MERVGVAPGGWLGGKGIGGGNVYRLLLFVIFEVKRREASVPS